MLRLITLAASLHLAVATIAAGATATPGQEFAGPVTLDLASGLTLSVPEGWRGAVAVDGVTVSMVGPDGDSTLIASIQSATSEEMAAYLAAPMDLGMGIVMTPTSELLRTQDGLVADYSVAGTTRPARGIVMAKPLPENRALALVGIAPVEAVEEVRGVLTRMMAASSIQAPPVAAPAPAAAPVVPGSPGTSGWARYMSGRYLARFYSGSGYHEKHEMWFCSDGTFATATDGGGFTAGVASGAFSGGHDGTWSASGDLSSPGVITLTARDGTRGQMQVQDGSDGLYLNGERWLRGDNERCR